MINYSLRPRKMKTKFKQGLLKNLTKNRRYTSKGKKENKIKTQFYHSFWDLKESSTLTY